MTTVGDEIWEHKRGKIWQLVAKMERENRGLRYQVKTLQARVRRVQAGKPNGDRRCDA